MTNFQEYRYSDSELFTMKPELYETFVNAVKTKTWILLPGIPESIGNAKWVSYVRDPSSNDHVFRWEIK